MIEDSPFAPRVITCLTHRKERATHLCTQLTCIHSPILCPLCLSDPRQRGHHPHDSSIKPISEGIDWLTSIIRSQSKAIEVVYERTIGSRQCEIIKFNLEKGVLLFEELDSRLQNMRMQLDLEMQILMKQFQKQIQTEKQEFYRRFQEYKRLFNSNLDLLKRDNTQLVHFQNSLKYYNNANSFTLKLITETEKKSHDWIINQKKVLNRVGGILENQNYTSNMMTYLNKATKSNLFIFPYWKGEKKEGNELEREFRLQIKSSTANWFQIPDLADLDARNDYPASNKYMPYPITPLSA